MTAFVEPIVIIMILIANAVVGVWQVRDSPVSLLCVGDYLSTPYLKRGSWRRSSTLPAGEKYI